MANNFGSTNSKPATKVEPFITTSAKCGLCGVASSQSRLKSNLFIEKGRDLDNRPLQCVPTATGLDDVYPPLYYIWSCPSCGFAAAHIVFEEPFKECATSANKIRQACDEAKKANPKLRELYKCLAYEQAEGKRRDHLDAVKLALLAILPLESSEMLKSNNTMSLGRYYLRLAWLFYEVTQGQEKWQALKSQVDSLIVKVGRLWEGLPTSEEACVRKAADYYVSALAGSYAIKTSNDQVEVCSLIARLYLKLRQIDEAKKYLQTAKDVARKTVEKIEQDLRKPDNNMSDEEKTKNKATARKLQALIDNAQNIFEEIRDKWEISEMERAETVLAAHVNKSAEERRSVLAQHKIHPTIINKVISREQPKAKKGLFGLFS